MRLPFVSTVSTSLFRQPSELSQTLMTSGVRSQISALVKVLYDLAKGMTWMCRMMRAVKKTLKHLAFVAPLMQLGKYMPAVFPR